MDGRRTLGIFEVWRLLAEAQTKQQKIDVILRNNTYTLRSVLQGIFDVNVKFMLPKGPVPFNMNQNVVGTEAVLHNEARRLYLFSEGGNSNLTDHRRQMLFVQLLEALHPSDARIICAMKDKVCLGNVISAELVHEIFPQIQIAEKVHPHNQEWHQQRPVTPERKPLRPIDYTPEEYANLPVNDAPAFAPVKVKKKRVYTEEQKQKSRENLAKARAAQKKKKEEQNSNVQLSQQEDERGIHQIPLDI